MATTKDVKRTPSGKIVYRGETFSGFNKPKKTPSGPKKSAVLAKVGSNIKLTIRRKGEKKAIEKQDAWTEKIHRDRNLVD